ncbi:MAG: T9SS type A sorting domain-containing protein [Bacteroidota bacterium]|nr:T9SS type A sorting domain-containing protein [Bacteroidota bacterium]
MKLNYFFRSLMLVALMTLVTNVYATDIPVADGATDTELAAALEQAATGDVILINGWITMHAPVTITKNVTIKAGVENAGFDGQGSTRLFVISPEAIEGAKLLFVNLGFINGSGLADLTNGGAAQISSGVTEFDLCYFDGNKAARGGAFEILGDGLSVTFRGCEATNNVAEGNGGESRGGYLFVDGNNQIDHENCKISTNQSIGGRGGALCLFGSGTRRFFHTIISDNKAGNWGPDPSGITTDDVKLDKDGNPTNDGEYEGGVAFITGGAITFESCALIANKSWSHSGIIRSWGLPNITFINSTLAKNQSMHDRSPIWTGEATYTFVNSLFVDNLGQNSGNGAGFDGDGNASVNLNIFNSVFSRNVAGADGAVDIRAIPNYATQLVVKNSLIGLIQGDASGVIPVDNPNIPTKSNIAMYKIADEAAQLDYANLESSGVDFKQGLQYSQSFGMPYYLLIANSTVTKLGDPALLANYDINTDLFGQTRITAADGSIVAAPTSVAADFHDAVVSPKSDIFGVKLIGNVIENGIIGIDYGQLRGAAKAELYSVAGQKLENVFTGNVVSKGYYNLKTFTPGIYLLKVTIEGKSFAQRLIVK